MRRRLLLAAVAATCLVPTTAPAATPAVTGVSWFGRPAVNQLGESAMFWFDARRRFAIRVPADWVAADALDGADPDRERDDLLAVQVIRTGAGQAPTGYIEARDCNATPPYARGKWSLTFLFDRGCAPLDASVTGDGFLELAGTLPGSVGDAGFRYLILYKLTQAWAGPVDRPRRVSITTPSGGATIVGKAYPAMRLTVSSRRITEGQRVTVTLRNAPARTSVDLVERPFAPSPFLARNSRTAAHRTTTSRGRASFVMVPRMTSLVLAYVDGKRIRPGMRGLEVDSTPQSVAVRTKPPRIVLRKVAGAARTYDLEVLAGRGSRVAGLYATAWTTDARGRRLREVGSFTLIARDSRRARVTFQANERGVLATAIGSTPYPREESKPTRRAIPR